MSTVKHKYELARRATPTHVEGQVVFFVSSGRVSAFRTRRMHWSTDKETLEVSAEQPQFIMSPEAFSLLRIFETPHTFEEAMAKAAIPKEATADAKKWLEGCVRRGILKIARDTIVVIRRPHSPRVFFLYHGQNYFLMGHPLEFLKETGLIDCNLVMFRDRKDLFYQKGISDEICDYESFINWHKEFLSANPHITEASCVGTSMGAYAAIQMGHHLRVPTVWAFALPVIQNEFGLPNGQSDGTAEWPDEWAGTSRLSAIVNLRDLLGKYNGVSEYHIFFNDCCVGDVEAAKALSDCPGVVLHPQNGEGHDVVRSMASQGTLPRLS